MTGGAVFFNRNDERVAVAVGCYADYVLIVAAGLALQPQLLPTATEEAGEPLFKRDNKTFPAHVRKGQHLLRTVIHDNGGDKAALVKFQ